MSMLSDTSYTMPEPHDVFDPILANHLRIAAFAAGLSDRLLAETHTDGSGPDDEYLRGYARAMSDLAEALLEGSFAPGGDLLAV